MTASRVGRPLSQLSPTGLSATRNVEWRGRALRAPTIFHTASTSRASDSASRSAGPSADKLQRGGLRAQSCLCSRRGLGDFLDQVEPRTIGCVEMLVVGIFLGTARKLATIGKQATDLGSLLHDCRVKPELLGV